MINLRPEIKMPYYFDKEIVNEYLKTMDRNVVYDAFTLNHNLEVVECKGIVAINNGYDRRDNGVKELQIITEPNCYLSKWFSLNREDVIKVQKENIKEWKLILENEIQRLNKL